MPATTYDFTVEQGADYTDDFTVLDANGSPENLTGSNFLFEVKEYPFSKTNKLEGTVSNGVLTIAPLSGVITLNLNPTNIALFNTNKNGTHTD